MNLSYDPTLHQGDVLIGGNLNGDFLIVEPSVGVTTAVDFRRQDPAPEDRSHLPSCGHDRADFVVAEG